MYKKVHYYSLLDQRCSILHRYRDSRGSEQVLLSTRACMFKNHRNYIKEGPPFVRKEPTRQIAWLRP